jgi:hypothetical protein
VPIAVIKAAVMPVATVPEIGADADNNGGMSIGMISRVIPAVVIIAPTVVMNRNANTDVDAGIRRSRPRHGEAAYQRRPDRKFR